MYSRIPACFILIGLFLSACAYTPPKSSPSFGDSWDQDYKNRKNLLPVLTDQQFQDASLDELAKIAKTYSDEQAKYSPQDTKTAIRATGLLPSKIESLSLEDLMLLIKKKPPFEHRIWVNSSKRAREVYLEKSDWPEHIKSDLREHTVSVGMTPDQVIISLGLPERINSSGGKYGSREQWVYGSSYLYFENGVVSSWQESTRP